MLYILLKTRSFCLMGADIREYAQVANEWVPKYYDVLHILGLPPL